MLIIFYWECSRSLFNILIPIRSPVSAMVHHFKFHTRLTSLSQNGRTSDVYPGLNANACLLVMSTLGATHTAIIIIIIKVVIGFLLLQMSYLPRISVLLDRVSIYRKRAKEKASVVEGWCSVNPTRKTDQEE